MSGLSGRKLARVQWDNTINWSAKFLLNPMENFSDWIPASDLTRTAWDVKTKELDFGFTSITVPIGFAQGRISITFYDSARFDVSNYFDNWINGDMLNRGKGLSYLSSYIRPLQSARHDHKGKLDKSTIKLDYVIPVGSSILQNASTASPRQIQVEFVVVSNITL